MNETNSECILNLFDAGATSLSGTDYLAMCFICCREQNEQFLNCIMHEKLSNERMVPFRLQKWFCLRHLNGKSTEYF